jgi:hypothetical protein
MHVANTHLTPLSSVELGAVTEVDFGVPIGTRGMDSSLDTAEKILNKSNQGLDLTEFVSVTLCDVTIIIDSILNLFL